MATKLQTVEDTLGELRPQLEKLRDPFPPNLVSKLPKESKAQREARQANRNEGVNCQVCGGWHHKHAVHLDYVGHAALTDRLLDVDPEWAWEPVGFTPEGLPAHDSNGGLWIKLTVCGVTRYGYGAADGKSGGDAVKEIIGDALRNAAMRFGAALDLWHKGDLHGDDDETRSDPARARNQGGKRHRDDPFPQGPAKNRTELKKLGRTLWRDILAADDSDSLEILLADKMNVKLVNQIMKDLPGWWSGGHDRHGEVFEGLEQVIAMRRHDFEQIQDAREPA